MMTTGDDNSGGEAQLMVVGYPNADIVARVPTIPGKDGRVTAESIRRFLGGLGVNVACAAAALGGRVSFYGPVGADEEGRLTLSEFAQRGIDAAGAMVQGFTPKCMIMVEPDGGNSMACEPLPYFPYDTLDAALASELPETAHTGIYIDGTRIVDAQPRLARAGELGIRRVVDLDDLPEELRTPQGLLPLLGAIDLVLLNRDLAAYLWGDGDRRAGLASLCAAGPAVAVLTLGPDGALVADRSGRIAAIPAMPVEPRDTTGAGDTFAAAFIVSWLSGQAPENAARFAAVAAALSTQAEGARGFLPTRAEVLAALNGQHSA